MFTQHALHAKCFSHSYLHNKRKEENLISVGRKETKTYVSAYSENIHCIESCSQLKEQKTP